MCIRDSTTTKHSTFSCSVGAPDAIAHATANYIRANARNVAANHNFGAHGRPDSCAKFRPNIDANFASEPGALERTQSITDAQPDNGSSHVQPYRRTQCSRALNHTERHRVRGLGR